MPDYDFRPLSPIDFETLTRDLLQAELGVRFESFKSGRDQGIDLRYAPAQGRPWILQSKHYAESGFSLLLSQLKNKEAAKVRKLAPKRYFLTTSLGLTPHQKDKIAAVFDFVAMQPADIFGREDLNNLLALHENVERQHFKLWFSSVTVFERMLQARILNLTRDTLQRIADKAKLYVQNDSFPQALTILRKRNVCIVCGIPGIGKTMLAEMLLLHFLNQGYDIVRITGDISEAHEFEYKKSRRLFYYDDFLGRAVLGDRLNKNEDQRLVEFVQAIRKSDSAKLILTTREYILNQARKEYERIAHWATECYTCVVDLSKYTRRIRAQILFNHVYFSSISLLYKRSLAAHPKFVSLVDHKNYNPRLVEFMTDADRLVGVAPDGYFDFFKSSLDNPQRLWEHAFAQISDGARDLVLTLFTLHSGVLLDDLKTAFGASHSDRARLLNLPIRDLDFDSALKETEGNFTATDRSPQGATIAFHNPSIADYVQGFLVTNNSVVAHLVRTAVYVDQLERLWDYREKKGALPLFRKAIEAERDALVTALRRLVESTQGRTRIPKRGRGSAYALAHRTPESLPRFVASVLRTYSNQDIEALLGNLVETISNRLKTDEVSTFEALLLAKAMKRSGLFNTQKRKCLRSQIKAYLMEDLEDWRDFEPLIDFVQVFPELFNEEEREETRAAFMEAVSSAQSYLNEPDDPEGIREDSAKLEDLADYLKVNVSERLREMEERAEEIESESGPEPDWDDGPRSSMSDSGWCSDTEIRSMFGVFTDTD
jgi:hypothetical protein